jgi:hypothetical protein
MSSLDRITITGAIRTRRTLLQIISEILCSLAENVLGVNQTGLPLQPKDYDAMYISPSVTTQL